MEQLNLFSGEFEGEVRAALAVPDDDEQEYLLSLKRRILDEPAAQRLSRRLLLSRPAWVAAIVLLALLATFLALGPQRVLAAVREWMGYLPGIGFVEQNAALRVLATPVEQGREGIVVTVEQVVADSQRTTVIFSLEGLRPEHRPEREDAPRCIGAPFLNLPGGLELAITGGDGEGWASGYRARFIFSPIPEKESQFAFMIPCLGDTRPGAAPENWVIELALKPAPPDFQPLPVVELPTSRPSITTAAPAAVVPITPLAQTPNADQNGIDFQVEKLVELEDGYLLQGSLGWQDMDFENVDMNPEYLQVLDAGGQIVPFKPVQLVSKVYDPYTDKRRSWIIQTVSKDFASPLTITLPAIGVDQQVNIPFEVDLAFTLRYDPEQFGGIFLSDPDHVRSILSSSGSSDLQGTFLLTLKYDHLPTGLYRILISDVRYPLYGPWVASAEFP